MRRKALVLTAIAAAWTVLVAQRGGGGGHAGGGGGHAAGGHVGGGGGAKGGFHGGTHSPVVIRMHQVSVPHPQPIQNPSHFVNDNRHAVPPARDGSGAMIRSRAVRTPPSGHVAVTRNPAVMRDIGAQQRVEVSPGRYYWHTGPHFRYVHYYDRDHIHWYGFYFGPSFYWCRYWYGRWWWYDPLVTSWVFWYNGYWWWQPPGGPMYVYVDNSFYPYDEAAGAVFVKNPEVQPPAGAAPPAGQGTIVKSPDGTRMVQISGDRKEAFLYDNSGSEPTFMKYLARGVTNARFSGAANGQPLRILLDLSGGDFAVFDGDGHPMDTPPAAENEELPGAPPAAPSAPPGNATPPPSPPAQQ